MQEYTTNGGDSQSDDLRPNAGRASGYTYEGQSIDEALINRITGIVTEVQVRTNLALSHLSDHQTAQLAAFIHNLNVRDEQRDKQLEARRDHELAERKAWLAKIDRQLGYWKADGEKLDQVLRAVEEFAPALGKIQEQVNSLSGDMAESKRDRAELRTRLERIEQMMLSTEQREEAAAFWRKLQQWYDEAHSGEAGDA